MAGEKPIAENRKARHDYHFLERFEAGIVLTGSEVKSLRQGRVSLQQAYADVREGEAWLVGAHIDPYEQAGIQNSLLFLVPETWTPAFSGVTSCFASGWSKPEVLK